MVCVKPVTHMSSLPGKVFMTCWSTVGQRSCQLYLSWSSPSKVSNLSYIGFDNQHKEKVTVIELVMPVRCSAHSQQEGHLHNAQGSTAPRSFWWSCRRGLGALLQTNFANPKYLQTPEPWVIPFGAINTMYELVMLVVLQLTLAMALTTASKRGRMLVTSFKRH